VWQAAWRTPAAALALFAIVVASAACTGERPSLAAPEATAPPSEPAKQAELEPRAVDLVAVATAVVPQVAIYPGPDAPEPTSSLANPIASGGPLVFVVERASGAWYEVLLPVAPAGASGWVRTTDVTVARHNYRIEVHLSEFRLDVYLQGQIVRQLKLAEGPATPPPGDGYFVTALAQGPQLDPALGTFAFVVSGWGDGATAFTGGPGQYALHGTADSAGIGRRVGTGSLAAVTPQVDDLATFLPLGVPVTVLA
jgi:hypothetical protein